VNTNDLHEKFEQALAHLVQELDEKITANNGEIQRLGHQVYTLEEENDKLRDELDHVREDDIADIRKTRKKTYLT
jgi:regulator of replication initiation timing